MNRIELMNKKNKYKNKFVIIDWEKLLCKKLRDV